MDCDGCGLCKDIPVSIDYRQNIILGKDEQIVEIFITVIPKKTRLKKEIYIKNIKILADCRIVIYPGEKLIQNAISSTLIYNHDHEINIEEPVSILLRFDLNGLRSLEIKPILELSCEKKRIKTGDGKILQELGPIVIKRQSWKKIISTSMKVTRSNFQEFKQKDSIQYLLKDIKRNNPFYRNEALFINPPIKKLNPPEEKDLKSRNFESETISDGIQLFKNGFSKQAHANFTILLGAAGMGKTTLLKYFEYLLLKEFPVIPLFLEAAKLDISDPKSLLESLVNRYTPLYNLSEDEFVQALNEGWIALLIDGLDEKAMRESGKGNVIGSVTEGWLGVFRDFVGGRNRKVVVAGRTEVLQVSLTENDYESAFIFEKWTKQHIKDYINARIPEESRELVIEKSITYII